MSYECLLANVSVNLRQTTISGTTLRRYDRCVGSLTSHRILSKRCETRPGVYGLSSLPGNTRRSKRYHYQGSTFSPVILTPWVMLWPLGRQALIPGVLPITAFAGRFRPKGVPFSGFRYMKGEGFHLMKYMKGEGFHLMKYMKGYSSNDFMGFIDQRRWSAITSNRRFDRRFKNGPIYDI